SDRGSSFFFSSRRRHTRFSRDWSSDVCSSDLMKPRRGISNLFLLRWARAAHDEIVSYANGSTFLEISKASFRQIRVIVPCQRVMTLFDELSRPWFRRVVQNEHESRTLAALRDTLLPKLISGELRVKDAERLVAAAT